ncbi:hypothetical protein DP73_03425 [Desulfosporosinus sp. HMP52]|uniref:hypothetical protein n=1 Tax=Desulfosporosinus sp. HMP52 TaxID=1487923 RepID=UPI00051FBC99|nr:hypothetical protein [Desulfosporosinus sp. HMP52]KGK91480.1 hypothetical protein DP73_03425 [Desulfosporosinus sp. HMP52]
MNKDLFLNKQIWIILTLTTTITYLILLNNIKYWLIVMFISLLSVFGIGILFEKSYTWKIPVSTIPLIFMWHSFVAFSTDQSPIYTMIYEIPFIIITTIFTMGFHIFSMSDSEKSD